jgi:sucrose phosphorylase
VSGKPVSLNIDLVQLGLEDTQWYDLVDGRGWMANNDALHLEMTPYDVVWLMPYVQIESAIETGAGAR